MAGTWFVVLALFSAAFKFMNGPILPFLYNVLRRLLILLFLSHTLVLTLFWKYGQCNIT